ncbi:hypothetical protein HanRHA438_Chr14g0636641 [Helianthus annuus]|nr:hypothetical protein HanIR_Chr14g0678321 [Helianthus annuus]KAJ0852308.1 hypothetical protein HanRHA438_Chr14g0636641 [Helianthus annuus]
MSVPINQVGSGNSVPVPNRYHLLIPNLEFVIAECPSRTGLFLFLFLVVKSSNLGIYHNATNNWQKSYRNLLLY